MCDSAWSSACSSGARNKWLGSGISWDGKASVVEFVGASVVPVVSGLMVAAIAMQLMAIADQKHRFIIFNAVRVPE